MSHESPLSMSSIALTAVHPGSQGITLPKIGTLIPNRIFVGGISSNTTEDELRSFFSVFGNIKDVKVIYDKSGLSKGSYGFVTFEDQETAETIIKNEAETLIFKDRKLNIGYAVRKQHIFPKQEIGSTLLVAHNACPISNGLSFVQLCPHDHSLIAMNQPTLCYPTTLMVSPNMASRDLCAVLQGGLTTTGVNPHGIAQMNEIPSALPISGLVYTHAVPPGTNVPGGSQVFNSASRQLQQPCWKVDTPLIDLNPSVKRESKFACVTNQNVVVGNGFNNQLLCGLKQCPIASIQLPGTSNSKTVQQALLKQSPHEIVQPNENLMGWPEQPVGHGLLNVTRFNDGITRTGSSIPFSPSEPAASKFLTTAHQYKPAAGLFQSDCTASATNSAVGSKLIRNSQLTNGSSNTTSRLSSIPESQQQQQQQQFTLHQHQQQQQHAFKSSTPSCNSTLNQLRTGSAPYTSTMSDPRTAGATSADNTPKSQIYSAVSSSPLDQCKFRTSVNEVQAKLDQLMARTTTTNNGIQRCTWSTDTENSLEKFEPRNSPLSFITGSSLQTKCSGNLGEASVNKPRIPIQIGEEKDEFCDRPFGTHSLIVRGHPTTLLSSQLQDQGESAFQSQSRLRLYGLDSNGLNECTRDSIGERGQHHSQQQLRNPSLDTIGENEQINAQYIFRTDSSVNPTKNATSRISQSILTPILYDNQPENAKIPLPSTYRELINTLHVSPPNQFCDDTRPPTQSSTSATEMHHSVLSELRKNYKEQNTVDPFACDFLFDQLKSSVPVAALHNLNPSLASHDSTQSKMTETEAETTTTTTTTTTTKQSTTVSSEPECGYVSPVNENKNTTPLLDPPATSACGDTSKPRPTDMI